MKPMRILMVCGAFQLLSVRLTYGFSVAEEYYKNDYPEEDDPSSDSGQPFLPLIIIPLILVIDEFHESSDYEDMMGYGEQGGDHDWR